MGEALKLLRIVQLAMMATVVAYAVVGQVADFGPRAMNPALNYGLTTTAVMIVGVIFIVRRTLVMRSAESLADHPQDALALNHWKTGYLATYVLCEVLAVFGLVLRLLGGTFQQSLPFYISGIVLLFFFSPRPPVKPAI
jgi:hypothetical protein